MCVCREGEVSFLGERIVVWGNVQMNICVCIMVYVYSRNQGGGMRV